MTQARLASVAGLQEPRSAILPVHGLHHGPRRGSHKSVRGKRGMDAVVRAAVGRSSKQHRAFAQTAIGRVHAASGAAGVVFIKRRRSWRRQRAWKMGQGSTNSTCEVHDGQ